METKHKLQDILLERIAGFKAILHLVIDPY